ncbi:hypothetical protein [Oligoflexus sp.]|uniref:hypothetical protein n=1 Tax=Oligoflexus sp. TaxID=1971216 RepID=UPI002D78AD8C|nr:hypothetical protein [Oligoflexus sp.]
MERQISVCWETESASSIHDPADGMRLVQEVVTSQYGRVGIHFTGWNLCSRGDADLRVWFNDSAWPQTRAYGRAIQGVAYGVQLTFCFQFADGGRNARCPGAQGKLINTLP